MMNKDFAFASHLHDDHSLAAVSKAVVVVVVGLKIDTNQGCSCHKGGKYWTLQDSTTVSILTVSNLSRKLGPKHVYRIFRTTSRT